MTGHRRIDPPELAPPAGFSYAVVAAPGRTVHLAGQIARDREGRIVGVGDIVTQFARCLSNLLTALNAAGGRPEHLVSMRIHLVDVSQYRRRSRDIDAVWQQLIGDWYPAMVSVGVARLWDDAALIEVEGIAVVPDPRRPEDSPAAETADPAGTRHG